MPRRGHSELAADKKKTLKSEQFKGKRQLTNKNESFLLFHSLVTAKAIQAQH